MREPNTLMSGITLFEKLKSSKLKKIDTTDNPADMMIKPLPSRKFEYYLKLLGVQSYEG